MDSVWAKAGLPAPGMPLGLLEVREWASIIAIVLVLWLLGIILWSATPHQGIRQIPHVSIRHTLLSTIRGESHAQFYQCHIKQRLEKYGMVRVYFTGRWLVYVSDPQYIYDFFYNPDTFDRPNPSSLLTGSPLRYFFGNGILAAYGKNWRRQRRIAAPAFRKTLTPWVTVMCTRRFMQALDQRLSEPIDIFSQLKRLTLEILGIEIFGIDFEVLNNSQSYFFTLYNEIIREVLNPMYLVLPVFNKLPWGPRLRTLAKIDELEKLLADAITQKRLNPEVHAGDDIVSILFRAMQDRRERLTSTELRDCVNNILFAGHDTTANALSFLLYHTARYKHVQTAARQEVLSVIPSSAGFEQLTDETLNQLQYGHAVIKESMRYEPVLSVLTNRHLRHDYHVGTIVLPKGTKMGVHVYGVHHNPQLWDQPDVFKPERFLTEAGRSDRALGWIPFAAGTHQCIGMQFAMRQIRIIFALLLYHYEWSLPVGSIHADQLQTTLGPVTSVRNLFLHFRKRA